MKTELYLCVRLSADMENDRLDNGVEKDDDMILVRELSHRRPLIGIKVRRKRR